MFKIWLRVSLILILLGAGSIAYLQRDTLFGSSTQTAATNLTQIVTVEQGSLAATISVVGQLDAPQNQVMTFDRLSGTANLLTIGVDAGSVVQAGDVLATIDPTPYQQALDQAQADLVTAQTNLADLQTPPTQLQFSQADLAIAQADLAYQQAQSNLDKLLNPDLSALQAKVSSAQLSLTQARSNLATVQSSIASNTSISKLADAESVLAGTYGRLTQETYSDAYYQDRVILARNAWLDAQDTRITAEINQQVQLLNAQASIPSAQQSLADAQKALSDALANVTDELAVAQAQQAVASAAVGQAQARSDRADLDAGPDSVQLASAQSTLAQAQQAVTDAQTDLAGATLTAPFAGTVLQANASVGDTITANSTILTLANLNQLQVVAAIDETTIRQVATGQPVAITFDAFPGQTFKGEVISVPLQGALQGGVMVYEVPISLSGADGLSLLVGMTANASISVGQADNALLVPSMAVRSSRGGYSVLVPDPSNPGVPQTVAVEIGLTNGRYTQITNGLNVGEPVLVQLSVSTSTNNNFGRGGGGGAINSATRLLNGR